MAGGQEEAGGDREVIRAEIIVGNPQADALAGLGRRQFQVRQQLELGVVLVILLAGGVEHVVDQYPTSMIGGHEVLHVLVNRREFQVVSQDAGLKAIHNLFREFNVMFDFGFVIFRMVKLRKKNIASESTFNYFRS